jgi:hypothetical protein
MSHPPDTDRRIAGALSSAARLLADRFPTAESLRERLFEHVFEGALTVDPLVRVLPGKNPKLTHWRRPYAIDTTAVLPDGVRLAIELKWGAGTLYNCSWDLAKLGVVLAEHAADRAYLIAGAPAKDWEHGHGAELFRDRAWTPQELVDDFGEHFAFWAKDVPTTGPIDLPALMETHSAAVVPVTGWGGEWSLRAARVVVVDRTWVSWSRLAA